MRTWRKKVSRFPTLLCIVQHLRKMGNCMITGKQGFVVLVLILLNILVCTISYGEERICIDDLCTYRDFKKGETVTNTAEPETGEYFAGWITDRSECRTNPLCVFTLNENKEYELEAIFAPSVGYETGKEVLYVYVFGAIGSKVISSPSGINCEVKDSKGTKCQYEFTKQSKVTLIPFAVTGKRVAWRISGCSGAGNCIISMTKTKICNARFY